MKKRDHIIFIEGDEISMFLAESVFSALEEKSAVHFFSEMEKALDFIKTIERSAETRITIFINAAMLIGEYEVIRQIKNLLLPYPSRFCLLTSLPGAQEREKELIKEIGISCFIEKPLTEEKLLKSLKGSFDLIEPK